MQVENRGRNLPQVQARSLYNSFETKRALVITAIVSSCMYIVPPFFHSAQRLSSCVISGAIFGVAYRGVFALLNLVPFNCVTRDQSTQYKMRVVSSLILSSGLLAYLFWQTTHMAHDVQKAEEIAQGLKKLEEAGLSTDYIVYSNRHHERDLQAMVVTFLSSAVVYLLARIPLAPNP